MSAAPRARGNRERGTTMRSWQSDRGLRRLVGEHRAGVLNRRQFLARLGGDGGGRHGAVARRGRPPGRSPEEGHRDDVGHRAQSGHAGGDEGDRRGLPQAPQGHRGARRGHGLGRHGPQAPGRDGGEEPADRLPHADLRRHLVQGQGAHRAGGRRDQGHRRGQDLPVGAPVAQVPGRQVLGGHPRVGRGDPRRPRRLRAGGGRRTAELEDLGRLAARHAEAQQGARSTTVCRWRASRSS